MNDCSRLRRNRIRLTDARPLIVDLLTEAMKREYRWTIAPDPDPQLAAQIASEINVSEPTARVLIQRGIRTYEQAKEFFRPQLSLLHDPFLMDGMEAAIARIERALATGERILVFGDYDVDGTNSAAMLYLFFRNLGAAVMFHIPDRVREGYGLSATGIDRGKEFGA